MATLDSALRQCMTAHPWLEGNTEPTKLFDFYMHTVITCPGQSADGGAAAEEHGSGGAAHIAICRIPTNILCDSQMEELRRRNTERAAQLRDAEAAAEAARKDAVRVRVPEAQLEVPFQNSAAVIYVPLSTRRSC